MNTCPSREKEVETPTNSAIYLLLADTDCTLRSTLEPTGYFVENEELAKEWVANGRGRGYFGTDQKRDYMTVKLYNGESKDG